ncbi:MAG TPA: NUDIX domain-containing protein [Allosphingosinicella sp.]|uniref:NUDIX domain-containing protein n=1 Tax=Allosphingosinicella sp. TaxID=2823234 RepID=UPI002EDA9D10
MLIQLLHRIKRQAFRLLRLRTRGVKVMLFNERGEILLIRNSYGASHLFLLPGGGVHRWEAPEAAAVREVQEEVGLEVLGMVPIAEHFNTAEGLRDTIYLFEAKASGEPRPDGREVKEACFFPIDALPTDASPATLRRIEEYRGSRPRERRW